MLSLALGLTLLYLGWATDGVGWLLFGAGPFLLGAVGIVGTRVSNAASITRLSMLLLGVLVGALPMLGYVILSGAWDGFVENTVFAAIGLPGMGHFEGRSYATYLALSVLGIGTSQPAQALGGAFWLSLIVLPLLLALLVARRTRPMDIGATDGGVLVAVFTGLLMAHYPSVFYIGIAAPAVLLGLLLHLRPPPIAVAAAACLAFIHVIGGGVGAPRGTQWVFGARREFKPLYVGGRVGLVVPEHEWRVYERVIEEVKCRSAPHDTIFVAPSHAELYFLAERRNPTPFFSFGHGVRSIEALQRLIRDFQASPPRVVVVDMSDPEFTPLATEFLRWTERHAIRETRVGSIRLLELNGAKDRSVSVECAQSGPATAD
jgi:hypothetical protein